MSDPQTTPACTKLDSECLIKASDNEPIFVLRAQDLLAPKVIALWCQLAAENGVPRSKIDKAIATIDAMEKWPLRKIPT